MLLHKIPCGTMYSRNWVKVRYTVRLTKIAYSKAIVTLRADRPDRYKIIKSVNAKLAT